MYTPPPIDRIPLFPTGNQNKHIQLPLSEKIQKGDIVIARYNSSQWAHFLPWENWHHAALVSDTSPLKLIEAVGPNSEGQWPGPAKVLFYESVGFGKAKGIKEIIWLKPIFPHPLREIDSWRVPISKRKIITPSEAKRRIVNYAHQQLGEKYTLATSKWSESSWYCSLLIYKSYSRTVTGMYLESHEDIRAGFFVTPEDILKSKRTEEYFSWIYKNDDLIHV